MEDQDQVWTQWKRYGKGLGKTEPQELISLPLKSLAVTEFERMGDKQKDAFRGKEEWEEVKKYYNAYHKAIQINASKRIWQMKIGEIPPGKIQYIGNTFILIHSADLELDSWAKDPGGIVTHKPSCEFRLTEWKNRLLCKCYSGIPNKIYKGKEIKKEVPF